MADPNALTLKLLAEMGVMNPTQKMADNIKDHFENVILEVFLRRVPENKLPEIRAKMEADDPELHDYFAALAAETPGLAEELEAAVTREYAVMKEALQTAPK
ncbi:MAG: hypothetical protein HY398_00035 [Candidatus Doudnabacteria bacterium]|nr:hypothetical protein [Candidatus Doudnabacteria bacterium]